MDLRQYFKRKHDEDEDNDPSHKKIANAVEVSVSDGTQTIEPIPESKYKIILKSF